MPPWCLHAGSWRYQARAGRNRAVSTGSCATTASTGLRLCCGAPWALFPFLALQSLPKAGERPCPARRRLQLTQETPTHTPSTGRSRQAVGSSSPRNRGVRGLPTYFPQAPPALPPHVGNHQRQAWPACDARAWQISQWPPCCQPGWPPSAFTGRNPVPGGSDFPQPALTPLVAQGRDTGRDALGLLNLPSSVPCVPSFRPGLAACGLTLQLNPSWARWPHRGQARPQRGVGSPCWGSQPGASCCSQVTKSSPS